jgi:hypothetical protein
MAGEAEIEAKCGQVVILPEKIQRSREPQAQLIAVQGLTFHLLEDLREIYRGAAYFGGDLGQCPSPGEIARQYKLGPIHQQL